MKRVCDVLRVKGHDVWTIAPTATVYEGIRIMADKQIGALMVVDDTKLVGVLSETDYTRKVILEGRSAKTTEVGVIMSAPAMSACPEHDIELCLAVMTEKRARHLPVVDGDELVGVVSIGDLVKALIDEQRFTIEQLERYITGC